MHQNIEAGFNKQGPELDKAFASLISDLDEKGNVGQHSGYDVIRIWAYP